jgi:hypothetical protein
LKPKVFALLILVPRSQDRDIFTDKKIVDFAMPRNGRGFAPDGIDVDCVIAPLTQKKTAVAPQMAEQIAALH